ncbi:hypothetical protein E5225_02750 [Cellulomonas shaoxiangyii]|uniref:Resolvase/invertase-type recombinase catalytic domain-containing protein n=1 Tax=Cellulomonas shaoxiangyii TaxID=2566013 RepID=A0A4P7SNL5_9CELL|nr:hypothetical protein E5225_02750 [Cellulomonas shaoxiangyii]TGY85474.1 hypothetical protein E5226_06385 [Cellulomonas shaoxiangyii]
MLIGYARVSTRSQDATAQRDALRSLGVDADRIYVDHGLTGSNVSKRETIRAPTLTPAGGRADPRARS